MGAAGGALGAVQGIAGTCGAVPRGARRARPAAALLVILLEMRPVGWPRTRRKIRDGLAAGRVPGGGERNKLGYPKPYTLNPKP